MLLLSVYSFCNWKIIGLLYMCVLLRLDQMPIQHLSVNLGVITMWILCHKGWIKWMFTDHLRHVLIMAASRFHRHQSQIFGGNIAIYRLLGYSINSVWYPVYRIYSLVLIKISANTLLLCLHQRIEATESVYIVRACHCYNG